MANFWRLISIEGHNPILTVQQRQAFAEGVGMTVIFGSKAHPSTGAFLATLGPDERIPGLLPEPEPC